MYVASIRSSRIRLDAASSPIYGLYGVFDSSAGLAPTVDIFYLNEKLKPFADRRVRQAIAMAIDRRALINTVYAGFGKPALTMIPSAVHRPGPKASLPFTTSVPRAGWPPPAGETPPS